MVSSFHPQCTCKRVEGYGKNWTHFMYKFDNLFWSIRVSDENSYVTRALHFLNLFELQTFFTFLCTIQRDVINFQHFLTSFAIFQSFTDLFRELNDYEIENHYKMNSVNVETWHGIIIHPHSMCKIVERVKAKTGRTSWTNWKISFGVSGFRMRTHLLHGHFIFLNIFELQTFLRSVCTIQSDVIKFQHFLTSFAIFSHLPICLES